MRSFDLILVCTLDWQANRCCSMANTSCLRSNEDWRIDFQKDCNCFQVSVLEKLANTTGMSVNKLDWPVNIAVIQECTVDLRCTMVKSVNKSGKKETLVNIWDWNHHRLVTVESKLEEKIL